MLQGGALVESVSGKCLDIDSNSSSPHGVPDRTKVQLYTCNGKWNQQWVLRDGKIINPPSGKCLEIDNSTYPGDTSKAQLAACGDPASSPNQAWEFRQWLPWQ